MGNGIVTKALILLGILGDGEMDDDEDQCRFIQLGMRKEIWLQRTSALLACLAHGD